MFISVRTVLTMPVDFYFSLMKLLVTTDTIGITTHMEYTRAVAYQKSVLSLLSLKTSKNLIVMATKNFNVKGF